jgi:hypothetical protein
VAPGGSPHAAEIAAEIGVHPVDVSFDWSHGTPESYRTFRESEVAVRDQRMAEQVLRGLAPQAVDALARSPDEPVAVGVHLRGRV